MFKHAIKNIIFLSTQEKMIWIYTKRHIAMMTNVQMFWNRSSKQFIRDSMSSTAMLIRGSAKTHVSVTPSISNPYPAPRFRYSLHLALKSLQQRCHVVSLHHETCLV